MPEQNKEPTQCVCSHGYGKRKRKEKRSKGRGGITELDPGGAIVNDGLQVKEQRKREDRRGIVANFTNPEPQIALMRIDVIAASRVR